MCGGSVKRRGFCGGTGTGASTRVGCGPVAGRGYTGRWSACWASGIDTLGDLCKLHKTDWLKFRNGGKKSLIELDDLLHDNGLDWAKWR